MVAIDARARVAEHLEHRLRERRALARIGADADLVERDERARVGRAHDPREVRDVRGEGREVLAEILRVADVGEQRREGVDARARRGRHVQPRAREQHGQRERLHRDRLAARVRTRDHEHREAPPEHEVVRHRLGAEQRVAELVELDHTLLAHVGRDAVDLAREPAAREREVDRVERVEPAR